MNTTSKTSFAVGSMVLLIYFLLFGGEVIAGILLLGWMLFTRRTQISRWVSANAQAMASLVSRAGADTNFVKNLQDGTMEHGYQRQRKLVR